jgi:predicted lactoylglutathione lyase
MTDYVCPDGGSVDEGITRDSYIEMIVDLAENGVTDLDALNSNQVQTVFELYTTHTIENRLYNDVGTKIVQFPDDAQAVLLIKSQVHDFIHRTVADALSSARDALLSLTQSNIQRFVDRIYLTAFELLRNLAVTEASEL